MKTLLICPTNYCNFKCVFCGSKKGTDKKNISIFNVEKILKKAQGNFKSLFISGGGEPLLAITEVTRIIELARENGFVEIGVNTNGSYSRLPNHEQIITRLKEAGLTTIVFSIDTEHLKFISYHSILRAIRIALKKRIKVRLKIVSSKETINKNENLIRRIIKDLGGIKIKIPLFTAEIFLVFIPSNLLIFHHLNVMKTDISPSYLNEQIHRLPFKKIIFNYCRSKTITINAHSEIFPCCNFHALNNPRFYVSDIDKSNSLSKRYSLPLSEILINKLAFARIYLRIMKHKNLKKILSKEKLYSLCDFCLWIQKKGKEIKKIRPPSNFELFLFCVSNLYEFLTETVSVCLEKILIYLIFNFYGLYYKIKNF